MTYTYAILEVPADVYDVVRAKLVTASYQHAFDKQDGREVIDMQGIALQAEVLRFDPTLTDRFAGNPQFLDARRMIAEGLDRLAELGLAGATLNFPTGKLVVSK